MSTTDQSMVANMAAAGGNINAQHSLETEILNHLQVPESLHGTFKRFLEKLTAMASNLPLSPSSSSSQQHHQQQQQSEQSNQDEIAELYQYWTRNHEQFQTAQAPHVQQQISLDKDVITSSPLRQDSGDSLTHWMRGEEPWNPMTMGSRSAGAFAGEEHPDADCPPMSVKSPGGSFGSVFAMQSHMNAHQAPRINTNLIQTPPPPPLSYSYQGHHLQGGGHLPSHHSHQQQQANGHGHHGHRASILSPSSITGTSHLETDSLGYPQGGQYQWSQTSPTTATTTPLLPGTPVKESAAQTYQLQSTALTGLDTATSTSNPSSIVGVQMDSVSATAGSVHGRNGEQKQRFVCKYQGCNQTFEWQWKYDDHKVKHTGEKPYICHLCDACFGRNRDLVKHKSSQKHLHAAGKGLSPSASSRDHRRSSRASTKSRTSSPTGSRVSNQSRSSAGQNGANVPAQGRQKKVQARKQMALGKHRPVEPGRGGGGLGSSQVLLSSGAGFGHGSGQSRGIPSNNNTLSLSQPVTPMEIDSAHDSHHQSYIPHGDAARGRFTSSSTSTRRSPHGSSSVNPTRRRNRTDREHDCPENLDEATFERLVLSPSSSASASANNGYSLGNSFARAAPLVTTGSGVDVRTHQQPVAASPRTVTISQASRPGPAVSRGVYPNPNHNHNHNHNLAPHTILPTITVTSSSSSSAPSIPFHTASPTSHNHCTPYGPHPQPPISASENEENIFDEFLDYDGSPQTTMAGGFEYNDDGQR